MTLKAFHCLDEPPFVPTKYSELPYGLWTCADGREVLFNRNYQPIWERHRGIVVESDRHEWVDFTADAWFYNDSSSRRRSTPARLRAILSAFQSGADVRPWLLK